MSTREQVAREAARLLYSHTVKEYKDAKEMAAASLGTRALPSNFEVAEELEKITEEQEGSGRLDRLMVMRKIALEMMTELRDYDPVLIGSVWRGTPRAGSDIDIIVYHEVPDEVAGKLNHEVVGMEKKVFTVNGLPRASTHIQLEIQDYPVEIVVRSHRDREYYVDERCDTYGDLKKGLKLQELERLMRTDPLRRFIPKRRTR
jgi:predicted nucleotidyltransferase